MTTRPEEPDEPIVTVTPRMPQKIYETMKEALGKHETLNDSIDPELGCAEAMSAILKRAGVSGIPALGFSGTAPMYLWLKAHPDFEEIYTPEVGAIIVSPSRGNKHGHIGGFARYDLQYANDWGICSNDSNNGLFREQWCYKKWVDYYHSYLGLDIHLFRAIL